MCTAAPRMCLRAISDDCALQGVCMAAWARRSHRVRLLSVTFPATLSQWACKG